MLKSFKSCVVYVLAGVVSTVVDLLVPCEETDSA